MKDERGYSTEKIFYKAQKQEFRTASHEASTVDVFDSINLNQSLTHFVALHEKYEAISAASINFNLIAAQRLYFTSSKQSEGAVDIRVVGDVHGLHIWNTLCKF